MIINIKICKQVSVVWHQVVSPFCTHNPMKPKKAACFYEGSIIRSSSINVLRRLSRGMSLNTCVLHDRFTTIKDSLTKIIKLLLRLYFCASYFIVDFIEKWQYQFGDFLVQFM